MQWGSQVLRWKKREWLENQIYFFCWWRTREDANVALFIAMKPRWLVISPKKCHDISYSREQSCKKDLGCEDSYPNEWMEDIDMAGRNEHTTANAKGCNKASRAQRASKGGDWKTGATSSAIKLQTWKRQLEVIIVPNSCGESNQRHRIKNRTKSQIGLKSYICLSDLVKLFAGEMQF